MVDYLGDFKRTKECGLFSKDDINQSVIAMGFVSKHRNLGSIIFVDLRDRTGLVQLVFPSTLEAVVLEKAERIKNEFVIAIKGKVRMREERNFNPRLSTGEIEIEVELLKILSEAEVLPFMISDDSAVNESLKLKYRYLDLRRPILQKHLILRNKINLCVHEFLNEQGFLHIETPFLGKSTPEGARDYLVPSRISPGCFYALPQSPQLYKQLLMISGFDRYYQIVKCFRDEDLRSNRQPEFTQIDIEMSFVEDIEDVMAIAENLIKSVFEETINYQLPDLIPRIDYQVAMEKYGSDKPDTRFALELFNITDIVSATSFPPFVETIKKGGVIYGINLKGLATLSRKEIEQFNLTSRDFGGKGVFTIAYKGKEVVTSLQKHIDIELLENIGNTAQVEEGDLLLIIADHCSVALPALGAIRIQAAKKLNLIKNDQYSALWITNFPLYEYDEKGKRLVAKHHPFTSPLTEDIHLLDSQPEQVRAKAYDLVINGQELGGGSIRIHTKELQNKMFSLIGLQEEDIDSQFGFFTEAFKFGVPPHAGIAFGLDRLVMLLSQTDNIKDVIAFPKNQNAQCLMTQAPSEVDLAQLRELFPDGKVYKS